jgi:hypothetical protein
MRAGIGCGLRVGGIVRVFPVNLAVVLLAACTLGPLRGDKPVAAANPITGGDIAVTTLEGGPVAAGDVPPLQPLAVKPAPEAVVEVPPMQTRVATPAEIACLKQGGSWAGAGRAKTQICIHQTKDAGKRCTRQSQCDGYCLARSGTCAPITPLLGCNDILQDNGVMVTLCID